MDVEMEVMEIVHRNLQAIWDADPDAYSETCAPDVSFFEWYVTTQRIDGIDFHLREILVHAGALGGSSGARLLLDYPTPLLALFFASGALREEIEDRTLTYAFTRPIPRAWLYYARVAAHLAPLLLAIVPALALIADDGGELVRYALAGVFASLAYGTLFALFGALSRGAAWIGLGFLIWEHAALRVPGFLQDLSLMTYVHGLAGVTIDAGLLGAGLVLPSAKLSAIVLGVVALVATLAGGRLVERREIIIER